MSAWQRTRSGLTAGRVLVGLLVVMNVVLCVKLFGSSGNGGREERSARNPRDAAGADRPSPPRAARRAGQASEGVRRTADEAPSEAEPAAYDEDDEALVPIEDDDAVYDRLVRLARPTRGEEQTMRAAFERHFPRAQDATRAGDKAAAAQAWRAYCDELAPSLDERRLKKMGCIEAPPPP